MLRRTKIAPEDLERIQRWTSDLALLARLLDVSDHLVAWKESGDTTEGGTAADALDQAGGLLEELLRGELTALSQAVERVARALPPPLE